MEMAKGPVCGCGTIERTVDKSFGAPFARKKQKLLASRQFCTFSGQSRMPTALPKLSLSLGQVAWAMSLGRLPAQKTLHQIRYLRLLGVPFESSRQGTGRGNRARYSFEHLIELSLGVAALHRGMAPKDVAGLLVGHRKNLRAIYRQAYREQPAAALDAPWVKARGRMVPILAHEIFLRLHDRFSEKPGEIDIIGPDEIARANEYFGLVEHRPGERARTLFPLSRLVLELVAWALVAPETPRGRQHR
jgi:hypothetical protein